jgi:hypothetical protein
MTELTSTVADERAVAEMTTKLDLPLDLSQFRATQTARPFLYPHYGKKPEHHGRREANKN